MSSEDAIEGQAAVENAIVGFLRSLGSKRAEGLFHERVEGSISRNFELVFLKEEMFLAPTELVKFSEGMNGLVYVGMRRGRISGKIFIPAPSFLEDLKPFIDELNYAVLNDKASWLFLCGRDALPNGISRLNLPDPTAGRLALVFNSGMECLGYGRIEKNGEGDVWIRNLFDLGDFLRREDKKEERRKRQ